VSVILPKCLTETENLWWKFYQNWVTFRFRQIFGKHCSSNSNRGEGSHKIFCSMRRISSS